MSTRAPIILVADHPLFRQGLPELLEQGGRIERNAFTVNPVTGAAREFDTRRF